MGKCHGKLSCGRLFFLYLVYGPESDLRSSRSTAVPENKSSNTMGASGAAIIKPATLSRPQNGTTGNLAFRNEAQIKYTTMLYLFSSYYVSKSLPDVKSGQAM